MKASYHNHTWRCNHAAGTEREYIEKAIEGGIKVFGFSDHTPQIFPEGYVSNFRMQPDQIDGYCDTITALKKEYASDIEIHIGLEVEYYPLLFDKLNEFLADYPIEYYLLGQHLIFNEYETIRDGFRFPDSRSGLVQYVDQCIEALNTGRFLYFAHPDVFRTNCDDKTYYTEMKRLCEHANFLSIPLEINLLGIATERYYPAARFWNIVSEVGNDTIFGVDAHAPEDVTREEAVEKAMKQFIEPLHLNLLDTINIPQLS